MMFDSYSAILLLLQLIGLTLGLQQRSSSATSTNIFSGRPISFQRQSTSCLWSEVSDDLSEVQSSQSAYYDWDEQFEELQSFMSKYGHCNFPQNATKQLQKKYPMLKQFCHDQRMEYKRLQFSKRRGYKAMTLAVFDRHVRCRRLEELGFEFYPRFAKWYDHYHDLIQHCRENGPVRVKERENEVLYKWVRHQHQRRNEVENYSRLSDSQIKLLDDIYFELF